jgi:hypothetical protein
MADCIPRVVPQCDEEIQSASEKGICPDWSFCLPLGGRLYAQDGCVRYEPGTPPKDGVYDRVVVENGCIAGLEGTTIPYYQAETCAPEPCSCSDSGGGGAVTVSPQSGNLSRLDASGALLSTLTVQAGSGISISGTGSLRDPLIIKSNPSEAERTYVQSGNYGVTVTGSGTRAAPYSISHNTDGYTGTINGMTFDQFGHLTSYSAPSSVNTVNAVIGKGHVEASTDNSTGVVTLTLADPMYIVDGTYRFGGYDVVIDAKNCISNITRVVTITAGERYIGVHRVYLTETGTIEDITDTTVAEVLTYDHAAKRFPADTEADKYIMTVETTRVGSFRIRYKDNKRPTQKVTDSSGNETEEIIPITGTIYVDGAAVTTEVAGTDELTVLTSARYDVGTHVIQVLGTMNGVGYMDLEIVTAY